MKSKQTILFSDFDGTFSEKDIGHKIFTHFSNGANKELVDRWVKGDITTRETLQKEASLINVTEDELLSFIDKFKLRDGAKELYEYTRTKNIPFYIISDGSDLYIKRILENNNLGEIKYYSNRLVSDGHKWSVEFLYDNGDCRRCGSCKGARINEIVGDNRDQYNIIFIGDSYSDLCALPHADIIFARGNLLEYCLSNNIKACEYHDFFDILRWLKAEFLSD